MSKPIEDPPSLVDLLAREHAERAARIAAEAEAALASDTHVDADTQVESARPATPARTSSPRVLVEELTRECARRRAALDDEARRDR